MKIEIKHRWSGEVLFACDADSIKAAVKLAIESEANLSKANLSKADLSEANLSWANLSEADLSEANLSWADLSKANLSKANLSWADLSKADLSWANLSKADLSEANLSWADLSKANLSEADLRPVKHDVWGVLLLNKNEVPFLRQALIDGKVDGSTYSGECACLCGTLAHAKGENDGQELSIADSTSAAERFFMGIKKGDTPETNSASKIALQWVDEFLELVNSRAA